MKCEVRVGGRAEGVEAGLDDGDREAPRVQDVGKLNDGIDVAL